MWLLALTLRQSVNRSYCGMCVVCLWNEKTTIGRKMVKTSWMRSIRWFHNPLVSCTEWRTDFHWEGHWSDLRYIETRDTVLQLPWGRGWSYLYLGFFCPGNDILKAGLIFCPLTSVCRQSLSVWTLQLMSQKSLSYWIKYRDSCCYYWKQMTYCGV